MIEVLKEFLRKWLGLSRPVQVVFEGKEIVWTQADARWWWNVRKSPSWAKMETIVKSNIAVSLVPECEAEVRAEFLKGYVVGKIDLMRFLEEHATEPIEEEDRSEERVTTIQEREDE
jgi:hypothetical protein